MSQRNESVHNNPDMTGCGAALSNELYCRLYIGLNEAALIAFLSARKLYSLNASTNKWNN